MSYKSAIKTIEGKRDKEVMIFALSTCQWCKKTKALLNNLGLGYDFVDVDLLQGTDQDEAYDAMGKIDPTAGFPLIIINGGEHYIAGYNEPKIKKLL